MIQRIQSIFLLLASGSLFSLFGIPFASSNQADSNLFADKVYNIFDNPILMTLAVLGGVIALVNIFLFKNRSLQLRLDYLVITLSLILPILAMFLVFQSGEVAGPEIEISENYLGLGLPILAIVFAILANRFISKDQKLVKSMDRLR